MDRAIHTVFGLHDVEGVYMALPHPVYRDIFVTVDRAGVGHVEGFQVR